MNKKDFIGKVFITNSFGETQTLGYDFGKVLAKGDIICLYGDLGSGKTTFVQGLAKGLGVKGKIISPTFIIIKNYESRILTPPRLRGPGKNQELKTINFYHIDLYRTQSHNDIRELGLEEILNDPENIIAIEWAENLGNLMPEKRIDIELSYEKDEVRKISFSLTT